METMQQYVIRKLNDRATNIAAMSKNLNMNRSKIYRVKKGGETSATTLQTIHDYLRKAGE
jgi:predicted transcriptional regulator